VVGVVKAVKTIHIAAAVVALVVIENLAHNLFLLALHTPLQ
jgi:hypothetical protein